MVHPALAYLTQKPVLFCFTSVLISFLAGYFQLTLLCVPVLVLIFYKWDDVLTTKLKAKAVALHQSLMEEKQWPDSESVYWINHIIGKVWHNNSDYITSQVLEKVQPQLQKKGVVISQILLGGAAPEHLPRLSDIQVSTRTPKEELILDCSIDYVSDLKLVLVAKLKALPLPVIVSDLIFKGRIRIHIFFYPNRMPFISKIKAQFLEVPVIDVVVHPLKAMPDVMQMPLLCTLIHNMVTETVSEMMMAPKWLTIDLLEILKIKDENAPKEDERIVHTDKMSSKSLDDMLTSLASAPLNVAMGLGKGGANVAMGIGKGGANVAMGLGKGVTDVGSGAAHLASSGALTGVEKTKGAVTGVASGVTTGVSTGVDGVVGGVKGVGKGLHGFMKKLPGTSGDRDERDDESEENSTHDSQTQEKSDDEKSDTSDSPSSHDDDGDKEDDAKVSIVGEPLALAGNLLGASAGLSKKFRKDKDKKHKKDKEEHHHHHHHHEKKEKEKKDKKDKEDKKDKKEKHKHGHLSLPLGVHLRSSKKNVSKQT